MKSTLSQAIDWQPTERLHHAIAEQFHRRPAALQRELDAAREAFQQRRVQFEGDRALPFSVSALVLKSSDLDVFRDVGQSLHEIVERTLDWLVEDPDRIHRWFPHHCRVIPYLERTPGLATWQGYSRYDVVITPEGHVRVIELNCCCPAGFSHSSECAQATHTALHRLGIHDPFQSVSLTTETFVDQLLSVEASAGVSPGAVGLFNDENGLVNELEALSRHLRQRGRQTVLASAADLDFVNERLECQGTPVSLAYNKIRVGTESEGTHRWLAGFERRYEAFLQAHSRHATAMVNNICCATLAEDKGLLALLHDDASHQWLTADQRALLRQSVPWTASLLGGAAAQVKWAGQPVELGALLRRHRNELVLKPACEGRGFGVVIGPHVAAGTWQEACRQALGRPYVVQAYVPSKQLSVVVRPSAEQPTTVACLHATPAIWLIRGDFHGMFSRVSLSPVTNVGLQGMVQEVLTTDSRTPPPWSTSYL